MSASLRKRPNCCVAGWPSSRLLSTSTSLIIAGTASLVCATISCCSTPANQKHRLWVRIDKTRSEHNESAPEGIATNHPRRSVSVPRARVRADRLSAHIWQRPWPPRLGGERLRTVRIAEYRVALRVVEEDATCCACGISASLTMAPALRCACHRHRPLTSKTSAIRTWSAPTRVMVPSCTACARIAARSRAGSGRNSATADSRGPQ